MMEAECSICLEDLGDFAVAVAVPGCPYGHVICVGCWQRHVAIAAQDGAPLGCPLSAACHHDMIDPTELRDLPGLATPPAETLRRLDEQSVRRTLQRDFVRCPGPGCGTFVEPPGDRSGKWLCDCPACGTRFCTGCGASPYHYGCSCAELPGLTGQWLQWHTRKQSMVAAARAKFVAEQQRVMEIFLADEAHKEQTCRLCPHCGRVAYKIDGCNIMRCGYDTDTGGNRQNGCGQRFDWLQAKPYVSAQTQQPRWAEFVEGAALRASGVAHGEWLRCDLCHGEMRGLRFQCIHCPAFNCCQGCEPRLADAATHNQRHVFRIYDKPEEPPASPPPTAPDARLPRAQHEGAAGEWQYWEGGRWRSFAPEHELSLAAARARGDALAAFTAGGQDYVLDFGAMLQTNLRTGRSRKVRRLAPPVPEPQTPTAGVWQWQRDDGGWENYPATFQDRIWIALAQTESVLLEAAGRTLRVMPVQSVQIDMATDHLRSIRLAPA